MKLNSNLRQLRSVSNCCWAGLEFEMINIIIIIGVGKRGKAKGQKGMGKGKGSFVSSVYILNIRISHPC